MSGEIDITTRAQVDAALRQAVTAGLPVVVDASDVTFLGALGTALLTRCARSCTERGVPFTPRNPSGHVTRVLDPLGISAALHVRDAVRSG